MLARVIRFGHFLFGYHQYLFPVAFLLLTITTFVLAEEEFLAKRFGQEYTEHYLTVNRVVPVLSGSHRTVQSSAFDWKRGCAKYGRSRALGSRRRSACSSGNARCALAVPRNGLSLSGCYCRYLSCISPTR